MIDNPSISIITASYNSEKYLSDTIRSVINQTDTDWEWLIVDDNSSDNSVNLIKSIKDQRIKLIESNQNYGAAKARNIGLKLAKGRFITFIDSDDIWLPDFLTTTKNFLLNNNEELVYSSYKRYDEQLNPLLSDFIAEDHITYERILYNCPMPMLTTMYDSQRIGKILIPENVYKREDYALWINVLKIVSEARAIVKPLAVYRIRENSYSRNKFKIAYYQFLVYYNFLKLSLPKSIYYTIQWSLNGLKKYGKFRY
ncbi:glycosyltransferase family 2 protein [Apibacter sp. HY039]|uniref:glycosyltransferase family 2 protein n=1 Tax=Apibacter sp. HY039 TaxID=2501476 RepID=UPI00210472A6|nr:glycosyltransferase family 2 protein [Apibacter sp. HY039]